MAKFDIRALNYTTSGSKQATFNIEYCYTNDGMILSKKKPTAFLSATPWTKTFFGDVGEEETMSERNATNKSAFYDLSNNIIIHPLYNISKTKLRSTATKQGIGSDNIDLYLPTVSSDLLGMCLTGNYAYGLTEETLKQPVVLSVVFNSNTPVDSSYHYVLSCDDLQTYLYPTVSDLTNDMSLSTYTLYVQRDLSSSRLSSIFSIARSLNGVGYNYLLELPEGTLDSKADQGFVLCDMAVTKTPHNYLYCMDISSDNYDLNDCREYCNIGLCGDLVYLTYRDNVLYKSNTKTITYYDNLNSEYDLLEHEVVDLDLSREQGKNSYSYLHVEVVHSFNRFDGSGSVGNAGHKSSMFSVTLHDTGLNNSSIPETVKLHLRQNIANNIRKIAEKICPANTLLFNVYFEGK